jgi:hypothetical protein
MDKSFFAYMGAYAKTTFAAPFAIYVRTRAFFLITTGCHVTTS